MTNRINRRTDWFDTHYQQGVADGFHRRPQQYTTELHQRGVRRLGKFRFSYSLPKSFATRSRYRRGYKDGLKQRQKHDRQLYLKRWYKKWSPLLVFGTGFLFTLLFLFALINTGN